MGRALSPLHLMYAWATPLKGVSPMHASNRPSGWPAAVMGRQGLLPEGLPLRARARSSIVLEYLTGMRSRSSRWPRSRSPRRSPTRRFWREISSKPQTQIVQGLEVRKKSSWSLSTRLVMLVPVMSSSGATTRSLPSPHHLKSRILRPIYALELLPRPSRSKNEWVGNVEFWQVGPNRRASSS